MTERLTVEASPACPACGGTAWDRAWVVDSLTGVRLTCPPAHDPTLPTRWVECAEESCPLMMYLLGDDDEVTTLARLSSMLRDAVTT